MKNKFVAILICILNLSCKSQTKTDTITSYSVSVYNPMNRAHERAFTIPLDTFKSEINAIIGSYFNHQDRIKELSKKHFSITIIPDSCGNITDVSFNTMPKGMGNIDFENILKKYIYSLKKLNIYYRDKHKQVQYLDIVLLYIEFDNNGFIIDLH